jgi:hypothetical protein
MILSHDGFEMSSSHADCAAHYRDTKPQLLATALLTLWKSLAMEICNFHLVMGQSIR